MVKKNKKNKTSKRKRKSGSIKGGRKTKIDIKFDLCEKKYCKDLTKEHKLYEKEELIKCPKSLTDMEFYDCSKIIYDTSNYAKLYDKNVECTKQYCAKERNDRARQYDNVPISKKDMTYWLNLLKKFKK